MRRTRTGTGNRPRHEQRDVTKMVKDIDEDEKILIDGNSLPIGLVNGRGARQYWFLTEDGFYEVCMTSRKPIAKEWKKQTDKIKSWKRGFSVCKMPRHEQRAGLWADTFL